MPVSDNGSAKDGCRSTWWVLRVIDYTPRTQHVAWLLSRPGPGPGQGYGCAFASMSPLLPSAMSLPYASIDSGCKVPGSIAAHRPWLIWRGVEGAIVMRRRRTLESAQLKAGRRTGGRAAATSASRKSPFVTPETEASRAGAFVPGSIGYALVSAAVNAVLDRLGLAGGVTQANNVPAAQRPGELQAESTAITGATGSKLSRRASSGGRSPASHTTSTSSSVSGTSPIVDPSEIADILGDIERECEPGGEGDGEGQGEGVHEGETEGDGRGKTLPGLAFCTSHSCEPDPSGGQPLYATGPNGGGRPRGCYPGAPSASHGKQRLVVEPDSEDSGDRPTEAHAVSSESRCDRVTRDRVTRDKAVKPQNAHDNEEDSSDYLPISAVAELVYCPRSFYYRMVEGAVDENAALIEGRLQEEKRAERRQVLAEGRRQVRSVRLVSRSLGLVGIADAVDEGDRIAPVEFKKGNMGYHLSHDIQVCLQAMALEEMHDIVVPIGYVYYAGSRTRREVIIDDDLRALAIRAVEDARRILESREIPLPAPGARCDGCSLRDRCMPFETSHLSRRSRLPDTPSPDHADHLADRLDDVARLATLAHPVPSGNLGRILYIDVPGAYLRCDGQRFAVCAGDKVLREVPAINVDEILMCGRVNWTAPAMHLALSRGVPITIMTRTGRLLGRTVPPLSKNGALRYAQYQHLSNDRVQLALARQIVAAKIANMRTVLMRYRRSMVGRSPIAPDAPYEGEATARTVLGVPRVSLKTDAETKDGSHALARAESFTAGADKAVSAASAFTQASIPVAALLADVDQCIDRLRNAISDAEAAASLDSLRGVEGNAARVYFHGLAAFLRPPRQPNQQDDRRLPVSDAVRAFTFTCRNRRPPRDPVNAMLSFGYAMLCNTVLYSIDAVGLDPYIGFYHTAKYARPSLALDLMEEFRACLVDTLVLTLVNKGMVTGEDFDVDPGGCYLARRGRAIFVAAYQARMQQEITHPIFNYRVSYRRIIELQARLLAKYVSGELDRYYPFLVR